MRLDHPTWCVSLWAVSLDFRIEFTHTGQDDSDASAESGTSCHLELDAKRVTEFSLLLTSDTS
jgi:hypothetical protein